jgi:type II secretory pathway pseudopilin PulG
MEILVALVVLGTGIVLLSQGLTAAVRSSAKAERTTRAALVADEVFQRMEIGELDFLADTEGTLDAFDPQTGVEPAEEEVYRSVYRWGADVVAGSVEGLYQVTLVVTWNDTGIESGHSFEAVRLFYRPPEEESSGSASGS